MKCSGVERILTRFVGEELEGRRKREIEDHLVGCERCRLLQEDLQGSRAWIGSIRAPSLGEAESVELRRGVWREIESRGLRAGGAFPRYRRLAVSSAAGLLLTVLMGLAVLSKGRPGRVASPPSAGLPAAPREAVAAAAPPEPFEKSAPAPDSVTARFPRARGGRHPAAVPSDVVKIEFQTANPDVRIIWLVKKGAETPSAAGRNQEVS